MLWLPVCPPGLGPANARLSDLVSLRDFYWVEAARLPHYINLLRIIKATTLKGNKNLCHSIGTSGEHQPLCHSPFIR